MPVILTPRAGVDKMEKVLRDPGETEFAIEGCRWQLGELEPLEPVELSVQSTDRMSLPNPSDRRWGDPLGLKGDRLPNSPR